MDIIILGLLLIQKCTVYEMRKVIDMCFSTISSNSMGSIQASIKKLLSISSIRFNEYVENGVNKKVYEITETGKMFFYSGISSPMRYKEKNMELSKFFFMGFTERNTWRELIEDYVGNLKEEQKVLEGIRTTLENNPAIDEAYLEQLKSKGSMNLEACSDPIEYVKGIAFFQNATLELSIDKLAFEIEWFEKFKARMEEERKL